VADAARAARVVEAEVHRAVLLELRLPLADEVLVARVRGVAGRRRPLPRLEGLELAVRAARVGLHEAVRAPGVALDRAAVEVLVPVVRRRVPVDDDLLRAALRVVELLVDRALAVALAVLDDRVARGLELG